MQTMMPKIVPAMEGWQPTRQLDNQTFFDMSAAGPK